MEEQTSLDRIYDYLAFKTRQCALILLKRPRLIGGCLSLTLLLLLPWFHLSILYSPWNRYKNPVDPQFCTNTCWDTLFKGGYEQFPSAYKHIYFNLTKNVLIIWGLTLSFALLFYESVRHLFVLLYHRKLHHPFGFLFILSLYSHYYSWWSYFNYLNDDFYDQFFHQFYFTVTELICSAFVLKLADKSTSAEVADLLVILTISLVHILASSIDQFITNVILGEGDIFHAGRDLALMLPDVAHLTVALLNLRRMPKPANFQKQLVLTMIAVVIGLLVLYI